jgi:basic membrane protein A and related proteins
MRSASLTGRPRRPPGAMRFALVLVAVSVLAGALVPAARAEKEASRARIVFVTASCSTGSFACPGFLRALRTSGMRGRVISPDVREDPVGTLSLLARQGYDLIVVELSYSGALAAVAPRFPKARFALFDAPLEWLGGVNKSNVQAVVLQPLQAAYLAGWLAARLEQRRSGKDVVGAVGGIDIPPVNDFIVGFRAGARGADPDIRVLTGYSGDFLDANKCEAIARSQIARGAGTVFNVAGLCGLGTLRAAKDAGVWGIGVDTDQSILGPHILTSVLKNYDAAFLELMRQVRSGRIRTDRTTVLTLSQGGAGLGRVSPKVPASLRAELVRLRQRIVAGEIAVPQR